MTTTAEPKAKNPTERHDFQAETRQLLDIVIHSLYSNKEIFLRELISNASDALDRLRFEALTTEGLVDEDEALHIRLDADEDARTLIVTDNGVGMSRDEVVENIGTIAKSGTRELVAQLKESKDTDAAMELIGQFGVGFYSAFMVADKVSLTTRRAGEDTGTRWESAGDGSYTLATLEGDDAPERRGTSITLHLKPVDEENGLADFTSFTTLQEIVKKHSDFVSYPIVADEVRQETKKDDDGEPIEEDGEPVTETVIEQKTLNSRQPIWTRSASDVSDEEYADFYKHVSRDWNDPLDTLSSSRPRAASSTRRCSSCRRRRRSTSTIATSSGACASTSAAC